MKIKVSTDKLVNANSSVLVLPIYKDKKFVGQVKQIDERLGGFVSSIIKDGYYTPDLGVTHVVYSHDKLDSKKIVLVGLGREDKVTEETWYRAISAAVKYVGKTKVRNATVYIGKHSLKYLQNLTPH